MEPAFLDITFGIDVVVDLVGIDVFFPGPDDGSVDQSVDAGGFAASIAAFWTLRRRGPTKGIEMRIMVSAPSKAFAKVSGLLKSATRVSTPEPLKDSSPFSVGAVKIRRGWS